MTIAETPPPPQQIESAAARPRGFFDGPIAQLVLARLKEFFREPEAVFWVYVFPILMIVGLGIAFRNQPAEHVIVDVESGPQSVTIVKALSADARFQVRTCDAAECRVRLRTGKTQLVVSATGSPVTYQYEFDPSRPENVVARESVNNALQQTAGRVDPVKSTDQKFEEPGGRYVDFLVPGLLGMSLMGGGLWGVGFVTVDMRIRKLLKRFLATPMKKGDFLAAIMLSRMLFMIPEVLVLLLFARYVFGSITMAPTGQWPSWWCWERPCFPAWGCWWPAGQRRSRLSQD